MEAAELAIQIQFKFWRHRFVSKKNLVTLVEDHERHGLTTGGTHPVGRGAEQKGGGCGESLGKYEGHSVLRNRRKGRMLGGGLGHMLGATMILQRAPHPKPGTCDYVTLCGKRDFADV